MDQSCSRKERKVLNHMFQRAGEFITEFALLRLEKNQATPEDIWIGFKNFFRERMVDINNLQFQHAIGSDCLRKCWGFHPWTYLRDMWMRCLGTRFSDWIHSARLMCGLDDLKNLFQPKHFCNSMMIFRGHQVQPYR